ncbi:MAG: hypothetical protein WBD68_07000 [Candidatus Sulfotelmatobacter sp.]
MKDLVQLGNRTPGTIETCQSNYGFRWTEKGWMGPDNSAFGEDDLLRMQVANNIGNAGDEQIMQMMTMEHIVVSVPAGAEV